MKTTQFNEARGQFAVFFTKRNPETNAVYEAGTVLFNSLSKAKEFMEGVNSHPNSEAHIYMAIGTDYNNTSNIEEELFV